MILSYSKLLATLAVATAGIPSTRSDFVPADMENTDIPWQNLVDGLSAQATLLPASNQDFVDQCYPEFRDFPAEARTNFRLRNQTSGLCTSNLACAFEDCFPPGKEWDNFEAMRTIDPLELFMGADPESIDFFSAMGYPAVEEWVDPSFPTFNVPSSVLFPAVAGDVVAAVRFAGDNGLQLSVKASGHNYAGASSKKDTLLINTFRFKKYSPTGIVECGIDDVTSPKLGEVDPDLGNQACLLALARGKNAFIRVGGGEPFLDAYRSVREFNQAQESFKYHMVGGAAPTVTPMGWTFQGGLAGSTAGRLYGFGLDQVLQIEAVLPNGQHVRFGPTSWEDQEGHIYPKTTAVSGVCNANPEADEEEWKWGPCPMKINFDDLWFAFRGGGGGTWGVVTSIFLQLHDYLPLEFVDVEACLPQFTPEIARLFFQFDLDYLHDPGALGISQEESNACGSPDNNSLWCFGEGKGRKYISTLKSYVESKTEELVGMGNTETDIVSAVDCLELTFRVDFLDNFQQISEHLANVDIPHEQPPPGWFSPAGDFPFLPTFYYALIPLSTYLASKEKFVDGRFSGFPPYMAFGANTGLANDQASSLSKAHRNAAFMLPFTSLDELPAIFEMYGIASNDTQIPAFMGANHYNALAYGPLKSDPTKGCNYKSLEEAEEKCYPTQVGVWGSENLARLEKIKEEIDPNYIFDCNKCVGNNRNKSVPPPKDSTVADTNPKDEATNNLEPQKEPEEDINSSSGSVDVDDSGGMGSWQYGSHLLTMFAVSTFFII